MGSCSCSGANVKIVWGESSFDIENEAKRAFRLQRHYEDKHGIPARGITPTGIATHLTHYPHKCEDCGISYWDTDDYGGPHLGCRGQLKKAGFS